MRHHLSGEGREISIAHAAHHGRERPSHAFELLGDPKTFSREEVPVGES